MKALKAAVILMSVVIVAGFGFVVYTIVDRMMSGQPVLAPRKAATEEKAPAVSFGEIDLPIPLGCDVDYVQLEGDRLLIALNGLDDQPCKQIIIMDTMDGRVVGRVNLRPPL